MKYNVKYKLLYFRYLTLLYLQFVKDYLYSYVLPKGTIIALKPYSTFLAKKADKILSDLRHTVPEHPARLTGSASLQIIGLNDIDIFIECPKMLLTVKTNKLRQLLGQPEKTRSNYVEWHITVDGYPVEISLVDPNVISYQTQIFTNRILATQIKHKQHYINLKERLQGKSRREYRHQKMIFLNTLLFQYKDEFIHQIILKYHK